MISYVIAISAFRKMKIPVLPSRDPNLLHSSFALYNAFMSGLKSAVVAFLSASRVLATLRSLIWSELNLDRTEKGIGRGGMRGETQKGMRERKN